MAVLAGVLVTGRPIADNNPHISADLSGYEGTNWPPTAGQIGALSAGGAVTAGPAPLVRQAVAGTLTTSIMAGIYGRVHIIPNPVNIGDVTQVVIEPVEVWNAHLDAVALSSVDGSGTDGITLAGQPAAPTTFQPNESRVYDMTVGVDGVATINGTFTFTFATESVALNVKGRRVIPLPFAPNWNAGFAERLEWLTDVLEARNGTEQRIRLRTKPRRVYRYRINPTGRDGRLLENLLYAWQSRIFGLPAWHQARRLPGGVNPGAVVINVDTRFAEYTAGGMAILWAAAERYEVVRVLAVYPGYLATSDPVLGAWPAGALVAPLHTGRLPASLTVNNLTTRAASLDVSAAIDSNLAVASTPPALTYQGFPVITKAPNRIRGYEDTYERPQATLFDPLTGPVMADDPGLRPARRKTLTWLFKSREAVDEFKGWLGYMAGRLNPVWIPDRSDDFEVVATMPGNAPSFTSRITTYADRIGVDDGRRDVAIYTADGLMYLRRILGSSDDGVNEYVTLDAPLGVSYEPADVRMVSFLTLSRLEADSIEIFWHTPEVATVAATFRLVTQ